MMATTRTSTPSAAIAAITDALYRAWKSLEKCREDLILQKRPFTSKEWFDLQTDIDVARDAYYIALKRAVATQDPSIKGLISQIEAAKTDLSNKMAQRATMLKILEVVDRIAGLAGKLLALGSG